MRTELWQKLFHATERLRAHENTLKEIEKLEKEESSNVPPATLEMQKTIKKSIKNSIRKYKKEIAKTKKMLNQ